ncbi:hypothetical protein PBI_VELVETEEN_58 [Mycobacterium phage Velveteen]|uniref:DNA methyltransferase n=1 Tax=Mycobacterium phage Velveteen TaxID=1340821 RepID=UPI0003880852|nr:DNA methyltransferase [Mycobacterium phage Velveteen]YP_009125912.1 DNA methyltransferase [Mycobacterium phage Cerasum]ARM70652.1 hypothetical protein SEA_KINGSLEY_60 [Mycobacterium phage Kingsley]AVR76451.1 hypothetical protein SEA_BIGPHIL_59 [Mycobacterium phage BigPhil]QOP65500.1 hypothetical protein SEA_COCO12_62 [Mycobacterium phage Coco12]QZD98540.1 hypothetical protein SEA_SARMA624_61 [Mycobacterium phage Sarma624]AGT12265.1 hypothetical protein PBI_VELVETEEN_58 [Mycobacterium phage
MSDQTRIEATIAQMFRDHFFDDTYPEDETECCVEEFLEALKANRIALIELPEPTRRSVETLRFIAAWDALGESDWLRVNGFGHIEDEECREYSPDEARELAAALLAAAAEVTE